MTVHFYSFTFCVATQTLIISRHFKFVVNTESNVWLGLKVNCENIPPIFNGSDQPLRDVGSLTYTVAFVSCQVEPGPTCALEGARGVDAQLGAAAIVRDTLVYV